MWPFKRKPAPPAPTYPPNPINEDWRAGDLAKCVDATFYPQPGAPLTAPRIGTVCKVQTVLIQARWDNGVLDWFLELEGYPARYCSNGFKKVRPQEEAADAEFTAQIKGLKASKVRA